MNYKKWIIGLCILNILPALSQEYNIENIHMMAISAIALTPA